MTSADSSPVVSTQAHVFDGMAAADIALLTAACDERRLAAGEALYAEGEAGDSIWIVKGGRVEVFTRINAVEERTLDVLGPNDVVGELAFIDPSMRSASARAAEPSVLLRLWGDAFRRIELERPDMAIAFHRNIARILAARLRRMTVNYRNEVEVGHQAVGAAALNLRILSAESRTLEVHLLNGAVLCGRLILVDHHQAGYSLVLKAEDDSTKLIPYHAVLWMEQASSAYANTRLA